MHYQSTFQRYEIKYLLTQPQKQAILRAMQPYMKLDKYGRTTIRNIYYDTGSFRLIRRSLEQPPTRRSSGCALGGEGSLLSEQDARNRAPDNAAVQ